MAISDPLNPQPRTPHEWERDLREHNREALDGRTPWGIWLLLGGVVVLMLLLSLSLS